MLIKGYLFYHDGLISVPIPPEFAEKYTNIMTLLSDLNSLIEKAKTDPEVSLSGYLLLPTEN